MRIVCPSCEAAYEIDAALVPPAGRSVACSACGHSWRVTVPRERPPLDEGVRAILREEAERAAALRRVTAERRQGAGAREPRLREATAPSRETGPIRLARRPEPAPLELQQELGLTDPGRARPALERAQDAGGRDAATAGAPDRRPAAATTSPRIEPVRREQPASAEPARPAPPRPDLAPLRPQAPARRGGFWRGIALVLVLAAAAAAIYVEAPSLARAVPDAEPWLADYVEAVNALRSRAAALAGQVAATAEAWLQRLG